MNLAVCDRDGGAVFEITPQTVVRREASEGILPCTNHFRSAGLVVDQQCWRYEKLSAATAEVPRMRAPITSPGRNFFKIFPPVSPTWARG